MATIFRDPLQIRHTPPRQAQLDPVGGTSALLLEALPITLPFRQTEWPVPPRRDYPAHLSQWMRSTYLLAGQDVVYGAAGEPPTPNLFPTSLRATRRAFEGSMGSLNLTMLVPASGGVFSPYYYMELIAGAGA